MGVNTPALPCAMTSKEQAITMQEQAGQHQFCYGDESQDMALPQTRLGALKAREFSMRTIGGRPAGVFPEQRGRRSRQRISAKRSMDAARCVAAYI